MHYFHSSDDNDLVMIKYWHNSLCVWGRFKHQYPLNKELNPSAAEESEISTSSFCLYFLTELTSSKTKPHPQKNPCIGLHSLYRILLSTGLLYPLTIETEKIFIAWIYSTLPVVWSGEDWTQSTLKSKAYQEKIILATWSTPRLCNNPNAKARLLKTPLNSRHSTRK